MIKCSSEESEFQQLGGGDEPSPQEGAQAVQRRLRRREARLHRQARREVPRPIRHRLTPRQGILWTGE